MGLLEAHNLGKGVGWGRLSRLTTSSRGAAFNASRALEKSKTLLCVSCEETPGEEGVSTRVVSKHKDSRDELSVETICADVRSEDLFQICIFSDHVDDLDRMENPTRALYHVERDHRCCLYSCEVNCG